MRRPPAFPIPAIGIAGLMLLAATSWAADWWRAVRKLIGVLGTVVWSVAACCLAVVCLILLAAAGFEGEQWVLTAPDGTTLMVTRDGFDGDVVEYYAPRQGWEWASRPEAGEVDPRTGCTLAAKNDTTLTVTCGSASQDVSRPPNR